MKPKLLRIVCLLLALFATSFSLELTKEFAQASRKTLAEQHATWLRHQSAKKSGETIEPGLKIVDDAIHQSSDANCSPGFTGPSCNNPICSQKIPIRAHNGLNGLGEAIELATSYKCSENLTVAVDNYVVDLIISVYSISATAKPLVNLYRSDGSEVLPDDANADQNDLYQVRFARIVNTNGFGYYNVQISSLDIMPCSYQFTASTTVLFDGGFTTDVRSDAVQVNVYSAWKLLQNPMVNVASFLAAQPSGIAWPGSVQTISFFNGDALQYPPQDLKARYNCSASLGSISPYICIRSDFFKVKFNGVDDQGFPFQRTYTFSCATNSSGETPTTPPPPTTCYNGGTLVTFGPTNSSCICSVYFEGNQCETKRCYNGGFLNDEGDCSCVSGYSGNFCQDLTCKVPAYGDYNLEKRALAFVVRTTSSGIISTAYNTAKQIIAMSIMTNPGYYREYVLVGFGNNSLTFNGEFTDADSFTTAIQNLQPIDSSMTNCSDSVYGALSTAVTSEGIRANKRSPIFLFTDVLPNDPEDRSALMASLADFEGQIFSVLQYSSASSCPINIHDTEYRELRRLAQFTHGLVTNLPASNVTDIVLNLAQATEQTVSLAMNDFVDQCSLGSKYTTFFIDSSTGTVYVIATGNSLTVTLFNTKNQALQPLTSKIVGNTYIYQFNTLVKGNYLLQIGADANSPCQFRILGDSSYQLFLGTALKIDTDLSTKAAPYNQLTNIVARVNHIGFRNPSEVYAEAIVWSNDFFTGNRTVLYAGNGFFRDQCDFHFYFEHFKCARRNSLFYISIFLTDRIGYTVQRVRSSYCAVPQIIPTSPDGCQNGGAVDHNNPNSTCLCPNGWTGDKCQIIVCLNNGTSMTDHCQCRSGYTGTFCEIPRCSSTSYEEFSPYKRSITFLVHDSRTTATMIQKMQAQMAQTMQDISHQHPLWINQYTLITFDDNIIEQRIMTNDSGAFITAFSSFAAENSQNSKATCNNLQVLQALYNYLYLTSTETFGLYYVFMRGIMSFDVPIFNEVQLLLETTQSQINFVETDTYPCNLPLNNSGPQLMWTIAGMTGGQVYIVSLPNAAGAMKTIPLQFRNGLIYEKYVADCTATAAPNGVNFYFPVDSETQTVSVLFNADLSVDPVYYFPNGSVNQYSVSNIYTDYGVSTRLDQIISPCDGYYRLLENRCWRFSGSIATWEDAKADCAKDNAILATIFDAKVEAYLYSKSGTSKFWIGLNDKNGINNWVWDQGSATPLPLSSTNYANWGNNQPNSAAGQCVYDSSSTKWTVDNCNTVRPFACVKHAYNVDYVPNSASDNKIFQGIWTVNVKSYTSGCGVTVFGQSGIQVYPTYTNDQKSDLGYRTPFNGNYTQYIASHVTGLRSFLEADSGSLQYAHFYSGKTNLTMTQVAKYTPRDYDTCKHQFISDAFNCPGLGSTIMHTGNDRFGYTFQRIVPALCYNTANTTCVNGGVYYNNKCVCPPNWGGAICQMPYCAHGQLASNFITCNCANTGFSGTFCQTPICVNGTTSPPVETNQNKTLAIVLDGSFTNGMDGVLNNLQNILTQIITNTSTNYPGWYNNFIGVVAFDSQRNGSIISSTIVETNVNTFITSLVNMVQTANYSSPQTGRALFAAVSAVTSGAHLQERSLVYVISAGNAEDFALYDRTLDLISFTHPAVHMFFIGDQSAPGNVSYVNPSVDFLHELSFVTGGGFYQVANYTQLQAFWSMQLSTVYNSYTVAYDTYHDCSNHSLYIQIAASNTELIFDLFTMVRVSLTITDAQNNNYGVQNLLSTRTNYLFSMYPTGGNTIFQPGIYTVNFQSTNSSNHPFCNLAVRGITSQTVYPAFTQDTGYDNGQHSNIAVLAPTQPPTRNAIVVATNFGSIQFVQAYDLNERNLLWASPMIARLNCVYGYSSKETFVCPAPSFALVVDGIDDNGHPYRRVQITHCKGFQHNSTNSLAESPVSFANLMAKLE